jgi:uncharacterized delta-60 repeat protein
MKTMKNQILVWWMHEDLFWRGIEKISKVKQAYSMNTKLLNILIALLSLININLKNNQSSLFALLICSLLNLTTNAQTPGSIDNSFNIGNPLLLSHIKLQPDGKILIGGGSNGVNATIPNNIARLNADRSIDNTFNPGSGTNAQINLIDIQSDGKILISGDFTEYNGVNRNRLARLNADGSLDLAFNPGTGITYPPPVAARINAIGLQSDGKIVIAGAFTQYNGVNRNNIARLNADGSLDNTFNPGTGANFGASSIAILPDGKILVGGAFTQFNGININRIARINTNGSLDNTFNPGTGANEFISSIKILSDGKILIGGAFTQFNSINKGYFIKLNQNGTLDLSFNTNGLGANSRVSHINIQPDNKILIAGLFSDYNGISRNRIARLNIDRELDNTFNPGTGANAGVNLTAIQADSKILLLGGFTQFNGINISYFTRLNNDGSMDFNFNTTSNTGANSWVECIETQSDGKILLGGWFTKYNGTNRNNIARLNTDGTLDITFNPGNGTNGFIRAIKVQLDGKIILGGNFNTYNNIPRCNLVRVNQNGSLDNTFNPVCATTGQVNSIALQPDGKIIIGGIGLNYSGTPRNYLVRLNMDGSLDTSFNISGIGPNDHIEVISTQQDGKIIISGELTQYNGINRNRIARLNSDGTLDETFNRTSLGIVYAIHIQLDGKILIGTNFTPYLARLNSDGSNDVTFNPGLGANDRIFQISSQPDGKILITGEFTQYNGINRNRIARLNTDGTLDENFNPGFGTDSRTWPIKIQPNGRVLIGGNFTFYNGIKLGYIVRIYSSTPSIPINLISSNLENNRFRLSWSKIQGIQEFEIDVSDNNFLSVLPNYLSKYVTDTTLLIENLEPGKLYVCRVRAINEQGVSPNSKPLQVAIKPAAPTALKAKALSLSQIELNWALEVGNLYQIEYAEDSTKVFNTLILLNNNSFTHSGLKAEKLYYYRLQAFRNGVFSDYSEIVGAATFTDFVTKIENSTETNIKVYPNPSANGVFRVRGFGDYVGKVEVSVINLLQQAVYQQNWEKDAQSEDFSLDLSTQSSGIYYLRLKLNNRTSVVKLIKN